jgi:hypothetical protein
MGNADKIKPFQWKKGQPSPNPGGRPRSADLSNAIREQLESETTIDGQTITVAEAITQVLIKSALSGDIRAIREIADRAEGRPAQTVNVEGEGGEMRSSLRVEFVDAKGLVNL